MKKMWVFILSLLFLFSFSSVTKAKEMKKDEAFVNVSVATLWTEPNIARKLDVPSTSNPVDMKKWTSTMSYDEKLWLVGNLETQALYGSKVTILEEQNGWVKVAVHDQPTPRNEKGYPGWMPKAQLSKSPSFSVLKEKRPFALVTANTASLFKDFAEKKKGIEISFNTRLPVLKEKKNKLLVYTPNSGAQWLRKSDASIYQTEQDIPKPTADDLIRSGKQFLGLPYLWAGMSGYGFDCSGFTYTLYKSHGITIPRDSSVQATHGKPVEREDLQKGDLIFFAYEEGKGRVHHVGMYIGNGEMIHSPNTSTTVKIDKIETSGYGEEYAGARRYLR
ncbi:C40 family peptidase [Priestia filamentosa]|uniref:C40 family peptidase n=1 Tax=Priestia filamentosa TaxID=1402861 RepID=UPI001FB250EE|nr:C40 family peptidase [Priestia filamentosa]MED3727959.1 C40 family peptidase [Priestia filamentosa]UOE60170.1 C40 family peptidase [Priestia filamentosa]